MVKSRRGARRGPITGAPALIFFTGVLLNTVQALSVRFVGRAQTPPGSSNIFALREEDPASCGRRRRSVQLLATPLFNFLSITKEFYYHETYSSSSGDALVWSHWDVCEGWGRFWTSVCRVTQTQIVFHWNIETPGYNRSVCSSSVSILHCLNRSLLTRVIGIMCLAKCRHLSVCSIISSFISGRTAGKCADKTLLD